MNVCRKTTIIFLMILLVTSIVIPYINANKIISVSNIFNDEEQDPEPPITKLFFDIDTGYVTLVAIDYPPNHNCGVKATYYKIDIGEIQIYEEPFKLPEGLHTVTYWSVDNCDYKEAEKSKQLMCDTEPPIVSITSPEVGWLYLFGSPIMDRVLSDTTICIGIVPVAATADDNVGTGVNKVLFSYNGDTGWDDTAPYTNVFAGRVFGDLTISVTAIDNLGRESDPVEMTIRCYSLG